jgi:hypothetical protein
MNINSILLFLLIVSLLFKEHWISKIFILIGIYTLFFFIKKKTKPKYFYTNSYFFFFLLAGVSLLWSVDVQNSLNKFIMLLPFMIIPFWISSLSVKLKYDEIFRNLGLFYIFVGLLTLFLASIRYNTTHQISEFYYHSLASPLSTNAIYISILYLFILETNLFIYFRNKNRLNLIISVFLAGYIFLLSSKMILILMFLSIPVIILANIRSGQKKLLKYGLSIATVILFLVVMFTNNNISRRFNQISNIENIKEVFTLNKFGDIYNWNGLNLRLFQFRCFLDIEKDKSFNSLSGVGLNNGQPLLNERYNHYKLYTGKKWEEKGGYLTYNFHNQYTQTLIEMGIIGFLFLIYIYYSLIVTGLKTNNFLLFTIIFTFILIMFTESILVRQKGVVIFVLFPLLAIKVKEYFDQKNI